MCGRGTGKLGKGKKQQQQPSFSRFYYVGLEGVYERVSKQTNCGSVDAYV